MASSTSPPAWAVPPQRRLLRARLRAHAGVQDRRQGEAAAEPQPYTPPRAESAGLHCQRRCDQARRRAVHAVLLGLPRRRMACRGAAPSRTSRSPPMLHSQQAFDQVVLQGARRSAAWATFSKDLTPADTRGGARVPGLRAPTTLKKPQRRHRRRPDTGNQHQIAGTVEVRCNARPAVGRAFAFARLAAPLPRAVFAGGTLKASKKPGKHGVRGFCGLDHARGPALDSPPLTRPANGLSLSSST